MLESVNHSVTSSPLSFLEKGSYATVFSDSSTKSAIKISSLKNIRLARNEYGIFSSLNDVSGIVQLFKYEELETDVRFHMEKMDCDLFHWIIELKHKINIKKVFKQIVQSVYECHQKGIILRDIKLENILVKNLAKDSNVQDNNEKINNEEINNEEKSVQAANENLEIKLCDFNISFHLKDKNDVYPKLAGSSQHIAPEALLQDSNVGYHTDVWSLGCVFYELIFNAHLLWFLPVHGTTPGVIDPIFEIQSILHCFGSPSNEEWPEFTTLPRYKIEYSKYKHRNPIETQFQKFYKTQTGIQCELEYQRSLDLVQKMLTLNPSKRITVEEILAHDYFNHSN